MRIRKYIYQCAAAFGLFALAACSSEQFEEVDLTPGNTPIQLSGVATRTTGSNTSLDAYKNLGLKLTSRIDKNASSSGTADYENYFENVGLTIKKNTTDSNKSDLEADNAYYPLSDIPLYLYGHTGDIDASSKILLKSGKATDEAPLAYDYLVSNGNDGMGTKGSSGIKNSGNETSYATLMTFRHVMTKLEVAIDVTDADLQSTKPQDIKIQFKDGLINKEGKYLITTVTGNSDQATDLSTETGTSNYELSVGTHFLVANGKTLSGTGSDGKSLLSSLKIDDYTATSEDLEAITIPQATPDGGTPTNDLVLKPGLAYKLTFVIERLKVVGIKLTIEDWKIINPTPDWDYDPYKMALNVEGGYDAGNSNNQITQIVLHHTVGGSDYQYVGTGSYNASASTTDIKFLSVPKTLDGSSTLTIDAYTKYGLLIKGQAVTYSSGADKGTIILNLSANGMTTDGVDTYLVTTPLQFYNLLTNPQKDTKYRINANIDMDALSGMDLEAGALQDFPTGSTLEGGTYTDNSVTHTCAILHLNRTNGGLFATNKGTIKNMYIFSGKIKGGSGNYAGGICTTNEGTIEGCVNEADIAAETTQIAGGICGKNGTTGKILACLNTGNIQIGTTVGGICGENANTANDAIKASINAGMLNKNATNLGGICGTTVSTANKIIHTCYWLTGTARKSQDINDEVAVGSDTSNETHCTNASDLAPERLRSTEIMALLNTAASTWKFELQTTICAWPIPKANP